MHIHTALFNVDVDLMEIVVERICMSVVCHGLPDEVSLSTCAVCSNLCVAEKI